MATTQTQSIETNTVTHKQSDLVQRMLPWARPYARAFAIALFLLLVTSTVKMLGPIVLQQSVDHYIIPKNFQGLLTLLLGYVALVIVGFVANYYEIMILERTGQRIIADLKKRAFSHLLSLDQTFFDQSNTGKLVSRIENDANEMKVLFSTVFTNILGNLLMVLGMFIVMAWQYDLRLAVYVVGMCPVLLFSAMWFNRWMEPFLIRVRKQVSEVNGLLTEVIHGIGTIQIFGRQAHFMQAIREQSQLKFKLEQRTNLAFNSFFNLLFFSQTLGLVMVLWFGGQMAMRGEMQLGSLILFMMFIRTFFVPIMFLSSQFSEFQKGIAAAQRIFELLDQKATIQSHAVITDLPAGPCTIEFRHVWFRYRDDSDWVLQDVSFVCPAGEHWALVGPTGSGKTTIISLLMRFYEPQKGQILINGVDIHQLDLQALRQLYGLVLQDVSFFPGTILRNLMLGQEIPLEKVRQVMKEIGLDSIIQALKQGYYTQIQEDAHNLSEGEQQLLSVGRALLRNPQVLILDEATSHIDPQSELLLQRAMKTLLQGRTALMIAHRLSTIEQADRILVLHYGRLVEQGKHSELMQSKGVYAQMRALQSL